MNKVKSFVKQFAAVLTGDSATAQAEKALRQADSALKTHIAVLTGDIVSKEDGVTAAKDAMANAVINGGNPITNRDAYVRGLFDAKNRLTEAEEALKLHQEKIAFLKSQQDSLDAEVDA